MPVKWPPLWRPCLPKIYRGGPEYEMELVKVPIESRISGAADFSYYESSGIFQECA